MNELLSNIIRHLGLIVCANVNVKVSQECFVLSNKTIA